jgi:drug/metabolite transporter (DMT)-like permease
MPPTDSDAAINGRKISSRTRRLRAIGLMCLTILMFAVLDTTGKYMVTTAELPVTQVVWVRFLGQAIFTLLIFGPLALPRLAAANRLGKQIARSTLMFIITLLNFMALKQLQLDQNITIFFLSPLVIAALSGPLLGEWIDWRRTLAICFGFLGVLIVIRPGFGGFQPAYLIAIGAMLCYSLYNISTRYLAAFDASEVTFFYSPLVGCVASAPFALAFWQSPQDLTTWLLLCSMGASGGLGHWLLILAHRDAPAPILAPFVYSGLLWMSLGGYLVFGDIPAYWTLGGCAIVIASGIYLISREQHRQVQG